MVFFTVLRKLRADFWTSFDTGLGDSLVSTVAVMCNYIYVGNYPQTEPVIYYGPLLNFGIWRRALE